MAGHFVGPEGMIIMKVLVIYDSVFGNTEKVAHAIGEALVAPESVVHVSKVNLQQLNGINLLIVGSPTRGFRPTDGIKTFLKSIPANTLNGVKVAAFDTRIRVEDVKNAFLTFMVKIFGYAAKPIADALQKKGGTLAAAPEGFIVKESEGPVGDGELERAAAWATTLMGKVT